MPSPPQANAPCLADHSQRYLGPLPPRGYERQCSSSIIWTLRSTSSYARKNAKLSCAPKWGDGVIEPQQYVPIATFAGSSLTLRYAEAQTWELTQDDLEIGHVAASHQTMTGAAGTWTIEVPARGPRIVFRPSPPCEWTAAFYPNRLFRGGIIAISEDDWYRIQCNVLVGKSRLLDAEGKELMRLFPATRPRTTPPTFVVALKETRDPESVVLLAVLAACYVLVVFEAYTGPGSVAPGG